MPANAKKPSNNNHNSNAASSHGADKGYAATNLLTFENCGARPKDGKLIADDGTYLEVNGIFIFYTYFFFSLSFVLVSFDSFCFFF